MDDRQVMHVLWLKRDRWGRLILKVDQQDMHPGVEVDPDGQRIITNPTPFGRMFHGVARRVGRLSKERTEEVWQRYLDENPQLAQVVRK